MAVKIIQQVGIGGSKVAIAHNTTTSGSNSFGSSVSFAHTTTGIDKALVVGVLFRSSTLTITGVTHNGNALTLVSGSLISGSGLTLALYCILNPDASGDVVISLSGSTNCIGIANSYTGVHQSTPLGTAVTNGVITTGSTTTINLSSASGELCVDIFGNRNADTPSITGGQTARGSVDSASQMNAAMSEEAGAVSVDMSWGMATSGIAKGQVGVPLKPSGVAPSVSIPVIMNQLRNQGIQ